MTPNNETKKKKPRPIKPSGKSKIEDDIIIDQTTSNAATAAAAAAARSKEIKAELLVSRRPKSKTKSKPKNNMASEGHVASSGSHQQDPQQVIFAVASSSKMCGIPRSDLGDPGVGVDKRFNSLTLESFQAMEHTIATLRKTLVEQTLKNSNMGKAVASKDSDILTRIKRLEEENETLQHQKASLKDRIEILQEDKKVLQDEKKALKIKVSTILNRTFHSLGSATSRIGAHKRAQEAVQENKE